VIKVLKSYKAKKYLILILINFFLKKKKAKQNKKTLWDKLEMCEFLVLQQKLCKKKMARKMGC
jgi:hypothetical protein